MHIVACPFCREPVLDTEARICSVCEVPLSRLDLLPAARPTLHTPLPLRYAGHGRGLLVLAAAGGLVLFVLPWLTLSWPEPRTLTGMDLSRRLGWPWAAAVAWLILVPTVLSRRTLRALQRARIAAGFLTLMPGFTVTLLLLRPPRSGLVPLRFDYAPALWGTLVLSLAATTLAAFFLGGPFPKRTALPAKKG